MNNEFGNFISAQRILHQTTCPDTPQNGVAKRKNHHILEVARSLMYTMNVPKVLWSEAAMTTVYLIKRTPSRLQGWKSLYEMLEELVNLLFHLRYLGALALLGITDLLWESWTPERLSAYLWVILQVKKATSVGILLNGVSLLVWM